MKVMFICSVPPFPKTVGKTLMIGGICEFLLGLAPGVQLRVMCFEPVPGDCGIDAEALPRPSLLRKLANLLIHSVLLRRKSIQESFFWSPRARHRIAKAIRTFSPDMVIYDTVRTGQYLSRADGPNANHILYMDDLFSIRYARLLAADRKFHFGSIGALGNFSRNLPSFIVKAFQSSGRLRKLILKSELHLVSQVENRCPSRFDRCLLVSAAEAEVLKQRTGAFNVDTLPPRMHQSSRPPERAWDGNADFVFLGSLNLSHNAFSIEHFIENEFAEISRRIPLSRILVVGKGASKNLQGLAKQYGDRVKLMGFVDDLDALLTNACAMLSPLLFGSGLKIKTIEALRCGVPIIATSIGVEGMDIAGTAGVCVQDDLRKFPDAMLHFLDKQANKAASEANLQAFYRSYGHAATSQIYSRLLLIDT